jgi:DSF synthase
LPIDHNQFVADVQPEGTKLSGGEMGFVETAVPAADQKTPDQRNAGSAVRPTCLSTKYHELDLTFDPVDKAVWCYMRPQGPPSFTRSLLAELIALRKSIQRDFAVLASGAEPPVHYFVGASRLPGVFNLGGDLDFFVDKILAGDRTALRQYAFDCVDIGYHMAVALELPMITIALVQGDALGGGFEGALSFNVLVAERSARLGLPEVLFNLFPGMGAYSFLSRRLDPIRAERMILSGRIYTAEELYDMGVVDILAEDGKGEDAVRQYIAANQRRRHVVHALNKASRRVNPITLNELRDVTEIWVETALQLHSSDLRKMKRLAAAQLHRLQNHTGPY